MPVEAQEHGDGQSADDDSRITVQDRRDSREPVEAQAFDSAVAGLVKGL
jgi:hypothetical protein